jgi:hypothetical protein
LAGQVVSHLERRNHWSVVRGLLALPFVTVDLSGGATLGQRLGGENVVDPQAVIPGKGQHPVIPPRVDAAIGIVLTKNIRQAPLLDYRQDSNWRCAKK